jgi:peptidoglycan/LPS O-acetylase OafA/YrhL
LRRLSLLFVDPSSGGRLAGIQGVRALAASSILLFHVWVFAAPDGESFDLGPVSRYLFPHLPLGVTLLFVLSGFLLYRPFAAAVMRERETPSLLAYLRNRALRILPAYWVILLVTGLVLQTTHVRESSGMLGTGALDDPVLLLVNIAFMQNFYPSTLLTGVGPAWALAAVVVFYLVLPLLVLVAAGLAKRATTRAGRTWAALAPAILLAALGLSGRAVAAFVLPGGAWGADWHSVIERSFWAHADFFAVGLAVAVLRIESEEGRLRLPKWWRWAAVGAVLLIALPTAKFATPEGYADGSLSNHVYDVLMALVCGLFLALVVLPANEAPSILVRTLETPVIAGVGVVSYSLFLWHVPLVFWLRSHGFTLGGAAGFVVDAVLVAAIAVGLSALTYRYLEYPALRRKASTRAGRRLGNAVAPARRAPRAATGSRF